MIKIKRVDSLSQIKAKTKQSSSPPGSMQLWQLPRLPFWAQPHGCGLRFKFPSHQQLCGLPFHRQMIWLSPRDIMPWGNAASF